MKRRKLVPVATDAPSAHPLTEREIHNLMAAEAESERHVRQLGVLEVDALRVQAAKAQVFTAIAAAQAEYVRYLREACLAHGVDLSDSLAGEWRFDPTRRAIVRI